MTHNTRDQLPVVDFVPQIRLRSFVAAGAFVELQKPSSVFVRVVGAGDAFGATASATGGSGGPPIRARARPSVPSPGRKVAASKARGRGPKTPRIKSKNRSGRKAK